MNNNSIAFILVKLIFELYTIAHFSTIYYSDLLDHKHDFEIIEAVLYYFNQNIMFMIHNFLAIQTVSIISYCLRNENFYTFIFLSIFKRS